MIRKARSSTVNQKTGANMYSCITRMLENYCRIIVLSVEVTVESAHGGWGRSVVTQWMVVVVVHAVRGRHCRRISYSYVLWRRRTQKVHVSNTNPVRSPDRLCGLSALLTSSVAATATGCSSGATAVTSTTCGTSTSWLPPDNEGFTSMAVRHGFSISPADGSVLTTGCASWNDKNTIRFDNTDRLIQ